MAPATTTQTPHRPGTKAWHDRVLADLRKKFGPDAQLTVASAEVDTDDGDPYLFTARITKRVLDRDGEVLLPGGMDATDFDRSGAVFWNHDYDKPIAAPIGKLQKSADEITGRARFMKRVDNHAGEFLPDYARSFVTAMAEAKRSAGVSIGFTPVESRLPTKKDREVYGPDITRVYTRWKLLEWSIAPVQANQEAFVTAMGKSLDLAVCKSLFGSAPKTAPARGVRELRTEAELPNLSRVKMEAALRRQAKALRKRAQDRAEAERVAKARLKAANIKAAPGIGRARARGELYVGMYDR